MASTALAEPLHAAHRPELQPPAQDEPGNRGGGGLAVAGLVHDARNLVTALRLCAELLGETGVLPPEHQHFAAEIAAMADTSAGLMRKLALLARASQAREMPEEPVTDLAESLRRLGGLLSAMAGPRIVVETACLHCSGTLRLSEESLARILLNLVRNAADAMRNGGRIRITAQCGGGSSFLWTLRDAPFEDGSAETAVLSVEDNGPGIRPDLLERIFEPGFSTRRSLAPWPEAQHQGLGLSIARELVEQAGGSIRAVCLGRRGARFEIELPLTNVTPTTGSKERILAGGGAP